MTAWDRQFRMVSEPVLGDQIGLALGAPGCSILWISD
jgi:hypothetical protein